MIFPARAPRCCRDEFFDCQKIDRKHDDVRFLQRVFDRHLLGFAAELGLSVSAFGRFLSETMMFCPPAVRIFASQEPMFPRPIIAVFMAVHFLSSWFVRGAKVGTLL